MQTLDWTWTAAILALLYVLYVRWCYQRARPRGHEAILLRVRRLPQFPHVHTGGNSRHRGSMT